VRSGIALSPKYQTVSVGQPANFECHTNIKNVTWTKYPLMMSPTAIRGNLPHINLHWLSIQSVELEDAGIYECWGDKDMAIYIGTAEMKVTYGKSIYNTFETEFVGTLYTGLITCQNFILSLHM